MRLLLIATEFPPGPGGIGTHAFALALHLTRLGWEITVVSPQDYAADAEVAAFNRAQPFRVVRLGRVPTTPFKLLYRWLVARRALREFQPHVLVATGERAVWLAGLLTRRQPRPWLAVGHGSEFVPGESWERRLTRRAFAQASAVVCVSEFTARVMASAGIRPRRVRVIPNGADAARFRVLPEAEVVAFRNRRGWSGARLLLTVGNVTERKGQQVVIRALPLVLKRQPDTHYLIVGLPTRRAEFTQLAQELGVADHVHFLGRVEADEVLRCLNACDAFVMTSTITKDGDCEGYGIAVVEAALCGRPAVVSAGSGLAEAIVDGETGFAVPAGDAEATASAILRLLDDEPLRRRLGQAALARARNEQTWENRMKEYDALLRGLLPPEAGAGAAVATASTAGTVR
jgi:phosphatidylinositol alpha-1,6-mannosyltransferase